MTPLWLIIKYKDYEIKNNVLIFKENGNTVYEFPIPRDYKLILFKENYGGGNIFVFSKYKLEPPKYIPEGYTNLTLDTNGLFCVENESFNYDDYMNMQHKDDSWLKNTEARRLYYMDTSIITPDDFILACNNFHEINEKDIPKSFWFSVQFRNLFNDFKNYDVYCDTYKKTSNYSKNWYEGSYRSDAPKYIKRFDSRARLINEYELITIMAYNGNGKRRRILINDDLYEKFCANGKVFIGLGNVFLDNITKVVSCMDDPNIYLDIDTEKEINDGLYRYEYRRSYDCQTDDKVSNRIIIPVIDEECAKKKVLSNNDDLKFKIY